MLGDALNSVTQLFVSHSESGVYVAGGRLFGVVA